ncbi:MAG: hypothetical protein AB8B85_20005 [Paracoccaceae bacterium]
MQIELNGMQFILSIHWSADSRTMIAEIVDEACMQGIERCGIDGFACVAALIKRYSGLPAPMPVLREIELAYAELLQDHDLRRAESGISTRLAEAS